MPLSATYTKQFEKDLKLTMKRGKDPEKLKKIILKLLNQEVLNAKHRDHKLVGNYMGRRDCHIEPDWLLIYKPEPENGRIIFDAYGLAF